MTANAAPETHGSDPDQTPHDFSYGHGRMPLYMKLLWMGFLGFATWYTVQFLLTAVGTELSHG